MAFVFHLLTEVIGSHNGGELNDDRPGILCVSFTEPNGRNRHKTLVLALHCAGESTSNSGQPSRHPFSAAQYS